MRFIVFFPDSSFKFEFECLFNATLTSEVISWRGRSDNVVAEGFDPKNSSSAGGALNHCATGLPHPLSYIIFNVLECCIGRVEELRVDLLISTKKRTGRCDA